MTWSVCWRDGRHECIHGAERAARCLHEHYPTYCEEAKKWPNVKKQIEGFEALRIKKLQGLEGFYFES